MFDSWIVAVCCGHFRFRLFHLDDLHWLPQTRAGLYWTVLTASEISRSQWWSLLIRMAATFLEFDSSEEHHLFHLSICWSIFYIVFTYYKIGLEIVFSMLIVILIGPIFDQSIYQHIGPIYQYWSLVQIYMFIFHINIFGPMTNAHFSKNPGLETMSSSPGLGGRGEPTSVVT
jgi:hypothetical protein